MSELGKALFQEHNAERIIITVTVIIMCLRWFYDILAVISKIVTKLFRESKACGNEEILRWH